MSSVRVVSFYKFVALPQFAELRAPLKAVCNGHGIRGTILLAAEGINGTLAGTPGDVDAVIEHIRSLPAFSGLECKTSFCETMPFERMKVRLKKEIVTIGVPGIDPPSRSGVYVEPEDWNALISNPGVVLIDARNAFEVQAGTFKGAIDPKTGSFGAFPGFVRGKLKDAKHRKIAMFCTGGIRCEKASRFMLREGFEHIHQLKGGILKYLEVIPERESLWQGHCFVFDERAGLGHGLAPIAERNAADTG